MAHNPADFGSLNAAYEQFTESDVFFQTNLTELNDSGASGGVFMGLDVENNRLTVISTGEGVEAGQPHPQHIHGFMADADGTIQDSVSPTMEDDTDGDGFVELAEGLPDYGGILLSLTDPVGGEVANFPAPDDGSFVRTTIYNLNELDSGGVNNDGEGTSLATALTADNLALREIVLHGDSVDGSAGAGTEGEVDGTAGYKATLPIASGELEEISMEDAIADLTADGRIAVDDDVVALDIGATGTAGWTYRLYETVLNRDPDKAGLTYWVNEIDEGLGLAAAARGFLSSDEFDANFGASASLSDEEFVGLLYQNALGREGDAAGVTYWNTQLDEGAERAEVLVGFSQSDENQTNVMGEIQGGILLDGSMMA